MLTYSRQYNIAHGIFLTYTQHLDKRLFHTSHKPTTIEKYKSQFPYKKYETYAKENFVLVCIYIMFYKTPSSFRTMIDLLRNFDDKELIKFKQDILMYETNIKEDINYLENLYHKPTVDQVLYEFSKGKIRFYTAWFFIKFSKKENHIKSKRVGKFLYNKLKFIMLFITFKDHVVEKIKKLLEKLEI